MNFRQIALLNELEQFMQDQKAQNAKISSAIDEIRARIEEIPNSVAKRGPVPGLKALKDRVEALETILNDFR